MRPRPVPPITLVALVVASALAASAVAAQRTPHTADVTTVVVEVPVQVVLPRGGPVRGLSAADFELYDGRRKQRLVGFEVIDLATMEGDSGGAGPGDVPLPARRHFMLLFDLSFSDPSAVTRARAAALDVVANRLHPSDLVAVATYSVGGGAQLVLGFTPDRRQAEAAIESLGLSPAAEAVNDPLRLIMMSPAALSGVVAEAAAEEAGPRAGLGRAQRELIIQQAIQEMSIATTRGQQEIQRGHATTMVGDFEVLGSQLRWVQGRKHVLLLSEGVESSLLLGTEDADRIRELNAAAESGEFWRVDSDERFGSSAAMSALHSMIDAFRRADATVHAIDIGGLRAGPENTARAGGEDSLFMMASGTGGELYRNFNDLGQAMERMLDHTSVTYVLSFQPEDLEMDGMFHPIRVRLKGGPDGARVVHRPGYYAPIPYRQQSVGARRAAAADMLLGGEAGGPIPVSVLGVPMRGVGELAHVPLLLEIDGPAFLAATGNPNKAVLELFAYALGQGGAVGDFFSQQIALDLGLVSASVGQRGIKFLGHLELPAGEYTVRTLVRDLASGASTIGETLLVVPRFAEGEASLLQPLFSDGGASWLVVGEQSRPGRTADTAEPLAGGGRNPLPAARPGIAAGGQAELLLMAYHVAVEGRRLEGRLLDRSGAEVAPASLRWVEAAAGTTAGVTRIRAVLEAPAVRPGDYRLEVRFVDPSGGPALVSSTPLRVGS